ncbi:MAG: NAD(P)H-hydrate dehydratase [Pseudomonadota bacterium]
MTELLTAAQMRAVEQAAIDSGEVTGLDLMERAGRGVVEAILEWRPALATAPHRSVVLCGPGNNGGDGFVVARLLKQRGWEVEVYLYGDEAKLPPDAAENCRRWRILGQVQPLESSTLAPETAPQICIDALFGTGLSRPLDGVTAEAAEASLHQSGLFKEAASVAVDLPTGVCSDSGRTIEHKLRFLADLTVSFHRPKLGHYLRAPEGCGELRISDIGLHASDDDPDIVGLTNAHGLLKRGAAKQIGGNKYSHGHAFVLAGGQGKGGASRLAARGALRIGAGLVTVGCPEEAVIENAARLDAVMLAPIKDVDGLQTELRARKVKAVCIGPGFGLGARLRETLRTILMDGRGAHPTRHGAPLCVVLDADALTEYRDDPATLFAMLYDKCVLTPHEGEFGRLFPDILTKLKEPAIRGPAYSKVDATREAARRAGCVVLFKGADTVIAHPDGRCSINSAHYERSAPCLATAGSGDVLAGFITGLLAQGFDPVSAADTAAWLHVECALKFGPGLIAEDISEQLPEVFRDLGV